MSSVYIIVNTWQPSGGENESSCIVSVKTTEEKALGWLEEQHATLGGELKANGYLLEVPLKGTDFNYYYIEDRNAD